MKDLLKRTLNRIYCETCSTRVIVGRQWSSDAKPNELHVLGRQQVL